MTKVVDGYLRLDLSSTRNVDRSCPERRKQHL